MQLFTQLTGPHSICFVLVASQVIILAFKPDRSDPSPGPSVEVDARVSAGVVACQFPGRMLQQRDGGPVDQFQIVVNDLFLQTAAALGLSFQQQRLSFNGFVTAVTTAFPVVHAVFLIHILGDGQFPEPFADPVLSRRMGQAAAALPISSLQLSERDIHGISAVAPAGPYN